MSNISIYLQKADDIEKISEITLIFLETAFINWWKINRIQNIWYTESTSLE